MNDKRDPFALLAWAWVDRRLNSLVLGFTGWPGVGDACWWLLGLWQRVLRHVEPRRPWAAAERHAKLDVRLRVGGNIDELLDLSRKILDRVNETNGLVRKATNAIDL